PGRRLPASVIAKKLGVATITVNSELAKHVGKPVALRYDLNPTQRETLEYKYWDILFDHVEGSNPFIWILRPELSLALEQAGHVSNSEAADGDINPLLGPGGSKRLPGSEGGRYSLLVTKCERDPKNRSICIAHKGSKCEVCEFDFGAEFGALAQGFIHVHHHNSLADSGEHVPDPKTQMSPLCPNCHAVAHLRRPPYSIDELKQMRRDKHLT
ncbi:MAG TPA: hypothetical protein VFH43_07325, partial [Candidatus Kapabacteria bacterium]|nr:hypothetical protein [Candidatus Kapabacteria bacterium]